MMISWGPTAGPVDVYADEKGAGADLWKKLVKVSCVAKLCK